MDTKFEVGEKVTLLDVKKVGEVVAVNDDGSYDVLYTDDGGVEQTEKSVTADKLAAADVVDEDEVEDEEAPEGTEPEKEE